MVQPFSYASLLLVTDSQDTAAHFAALLPSDRFAPELNVCAGREAPYVLGETVYDVVVIDGGALDAGNGGALAAQAAENGVTAVLLLAPEGRFEAVSRFADQHGFMALPSPADPALLKQSLGMMATVSRRMRQLALRAENLQAKMDEMKLVDRAKLLLVQRFNMTEKQAHRFIEKNAMDRCVTRRAIAEKIIRTYEI